MSQVPRPKHFEIDPQQYGDTVLLRLSGEFDLAGEALFDHALTGLPQTARKIVVDLSGLTFIDSSGLRALLGAWRRARSDGFDLAVIPGTDQVRNTMELTGVDRVLPIATDAPTGAVAMTRTAGAGAA
jgi:anti-anti-sigma factor